jgi:DNA polymerase I-like protein with 3'-5' exonuclease and polymerase domains
MALSYHDLRTDTGRAYLYDELPVRCLPYQEREPALTFVFQGTAEGGFCQSLGLPLPTYPIDLMVETLLRLNVCVSRRHLQALRETVGERYAYANRVLGLLEACDLYGLPALMSADDKDEGRQWILDGWDSIRAHRDGIRAYAAQDAKVTAQLAEKMLPDLSSLVQAVNRGRFTMAYGRMLQRGLPFDVERFEILQTHWELFRDALIDEVDPKRLVVSDSGEFRDAGFDTLIRQLGLHPVWPRTRTGKFKRDQDALRAHRDLHPAIDQLAELRATLKSFRTSAESGTLFGFAIGQDGRLRYDVLAPMGTHTGRVRPLGNGNPLLGPKWARGFIRSESGCLLVPDWTAQEIMIAAGLSGDARMRDWYAEDIYLEMAKALHLAPPDATKASHREVRDVFKAVVLGCLYGRGESSIAAELNIPRWKAKQFIAAFDRLFPDVRTFQRGLSREARALGCVETCDGWRGEVVPRFTKPTTLLNWVIQAHGATVLRYTVTLLDSQDIPLLATLHDSLMAECSEATLPDLQHRIESEMRYAGELVCGYPIDVEMRVLGPGERYLEAGKPQETWDRIWGKLKAQGVPVPNT